MLKKEYILTNHVKKRMKERGISEDEIEAVLENPEYSYPRMKEEINKVKTIKGKKIRVVYKQKQKRKIIMTALLMS